MELFSDSSIWIEHYQAQEKSEFESGNQIARSYQEFSRKNDVEDECQ
jgi:hypothetical protein